MISLLTNRHASNMSANNTAALPKPFHRHASLFAAAAYKSIDTHSNSHKPHHLPCEQ